MHQDFMKKKIQQNLNPETKKFFDDQQTDAKNEFNDFKTCREKCKVCENDADQITECELD